MRIAIVEDEVKEQERLLGFLKRYEEEKGEKFQIRVFQDGDGIVNNYSMDYDLILMDIEMKFMDGMSAARCIREMDEEVFILFITNVSKYGMKGYEVDALDYLLKPVSYFALEQRLDKARRKAGRKSDDYIRVSVKGGFQKINISHIRYLEISNREMIYHTLEGKIYTRDTIREMEHVLNKKQFFRCNKCYLINLSYVDGMQGNDIRIGDDLLQLSRARKKAFLDAMNEYMNEVDL